MNENGNEEPVFEIGVVIPRRAVREKDESCNCACVLVKEFENVSFVVQRVIGIADEFIKLSAPLETLGRAAAELPIKKRTHIGMDLKFEVEEVEAFVKRLFSWCERFQCYCHLIYGILNNSKSAKILKFDGKEIRWEIGESLISKLESENIVKQVICSLCGIEQEVQQYCINCGVCMGKYFCGTCKLFDDDISKQQYHCNGCGICRTGGSENFFHCYKCGCWHSTLLKNSHPCIEGAMHHDCPICFEYLFESRNDVTVMPCGHTIHKSCLNEMREYFQYTCPLCSKSVCDMSKVWEKFDIEIAATPMPEAYENKMVWILCNDCGKTSNVHFHFVAQKCPNCKSYNIRHTRG